MRTVLMQLSVLLLAGLASLLPHGVARAAAEAGLECGCIACMEEAWAMTPDPQAYVAPSRNYRTLHTALDLDLDLHGQRIDGSVTHTLECLRPETRELQLNCVGLEIERVELDGVAATWQYPVPGKQETSWLSYQGAGESSNMLRIVPDPAQQLARGQQVRLAIWYRGQPANGLHFQQPEPGSGYARHEVWSQGQAENNRFWFPCFDYPSDKSTYEGRFRVAKPYSVLSNGVLLETRDLGTQREFHWRLDQPQPSYLMMVAAGEYEVYTDDWRGLEVSYWVPPGTGEATARRVFGQTTDMLDFFSEVCGVGYPYGKYAQVVVQNFIHGGMENTTATVMTERILFSESGALTRDSQGLIAHELAHMWWGDMLTCREWTQMWLNEGFATYFQKLYRQHADGDDEFMYEMDDAHADVLRADARDPRPLVVDFFNRRDAQNNANIYVKGASVLDMLREYVGDEVFFDAIGRYARRHQWETVETADLARAFREASGENLDWFFEQWVYMSGHPDLRVTKQWDEGRKLLTLTVEQTQTVSEQVPLFRLPLTVEFACEHGAERQTFDIVVDKQRQEFHFSLPAEPWMTLFDKGGHTLKTLDFKRSETELVAQLKVGDTWGRIEAARALGDFAGHREAQLWLFKTLWLPGFWGVRKECAIALAKHGTPEAQESLLLSLQHPDHRTRLAVVEQADKLALTPEVEARLVALFESDPADSVRAAALTGLRRLKSDKAPALLVRALSMPSDRDALINAGLDGIGALELTGELARVKALAAPGNSRGYRHNALDVYAKLAKLHKDNAQRAAAVAFINPMLDDWYPRTRGSAIGALVTLGEKSAVDRLKLLALHDPSERIRRQADEAARTLETAQSPQPNWDEMTKQMQALQAELDRLKGVVGELERRVPQTPRE